MEPTERIIRDPHISGGAWTIQGTRIPVQTIVASLAEGDSVQEILASFPTLTEQDVQTAAAWAADLSTAHSPFDLIGAFSSDKPLIDNIPVSADPGLYLLAEAMGEQAQGLHAWEIAPQRYREGKDGQAIRLTSPYMMTFTAVAAPHRARLAGS